MAAGRRIAILGAGSVGCFIGGAWASAGIPVSFIGRPRIAHEVRDFGLTLTDFSGWKATLSPGQVDYSCIPDALGGAAVVVVCVKSGATADAARDIARHADEGALVISFQNGVSNVELLRAALGHRFAVVQAMVPFNVAHLGEGRFHKGVAGQLFADDRSEMRALATAIATAFATVFPTRPGTAPATLRLSHDMVGMMWGKLLINLNNAINALSGQTLMEELTQRDYRRVFACAMREGLGLLRSAGIKPAKIGPIAPRLLPMVIGSPDWLFNRVFIKRWKIDAHARSSMADDLEQGRTTEIDVLNGELVRLAGRIGRDAPINARIVELVRRAEAGAPPWSAAALRRQVLGL
ncbi:MAG: 2-dehydropantoate 2-reductase [Sphingomicrobium sp.]